MNCCQILCLCRRKEVFALLPPSAVPIVLASSSPRRQELLALLNIPFEIVPSFADETAEGTGADRVYALAQRKAEDVAARMPGRTVLAADTLVCVDDAVLGKPIDRADAARMLALLSGRDHHVYTGVCLIAPHQPPQTEVCATTVHFVPLTADWIDRYIDTGEPFGKAGAYAIQGHAGAFVDCIQGSPSNVIGLPLETVARMLDGLGLSLF